MKFIATAIAATCLGFVTLSQTKSFTEKLDGVKTSSKELTKNAGTDNSSIGQSGVMTTSVPLVTVTSRTMSFPLNLQYASGIKVDQSSGSVGLGWVLPVGSIVRDYGAFEPDYTATSSEVLMQNAVPGNNDGWIAPEVGPSFDPFTNRQYLGYDAIDATAMTTPMSDEYHISVPGFISNTFWNNGTPGGQHQWALTQYEQWKIAGSPKIFTISQEFSRINEQTIGLTTGNFDTQGSFAAAIGVLPYVKNTKLYGPTGSTSAGWLPDEIARTVEYEDFGGFTIVDEKGTVYVFGRALRGQKFVFSDDPYWSTRVARDEFGNPGYNANEGNFWKIDYIAEWLLTEIRSADYVDVNGNGIADDGDAGDWIRFEYTAPTKTIPTSQAGGTNARLQQEVPMYREWASFSQTDQASSLMRERAYLSRIVTPLQELDLTISQRMEVDHDFYSKPANKVGNGFYFVDRKYVSEGSITDFDVEFPVETMKYDTLKLYSRLISKELYPTENTLLSVAVLKYAEKGSSQELAVSSYLIRDNNNVDKLIDKPGDALNITDYHSTTVKRGKTTLLGVDFYGGYIHETEKTSYSFEYAFNPRYDEIHKRHIVNKFYFPSIRQGYKNNLLLPDLRAENPMNYTEIVTASVGSINHNGISAYDFLIDFPYHERYYKITDYGAFNATNEEIESIFEDQFTLNSWERPHPLTPITDVFGFYFDPNDSLAARAWSLSKVTYPTGGQVSFEYERGYYAKNTDSQHWSFGENAVPMIREYNAVAQKRSYVQDYFNHIAELHDMYEDWTSQKTLSASFEVDLPDRYGIRLKSKTVNDRINPVVVTTYAYGAGHMSSLPSDYVANCIGGFNSFIMRERLRNDWEKNYYPPGFDSPGLVWTTDYDMKMRYLARTNIILDGYSSAHFYETTDIILADGAKSRTHYGAINGVMNDFYADFSLFCTRLHSEDWDGRYVIGGNSLSTTPIAAYKDELYRAGESVPYSIKRTTYARTEITNKKIKFKYNKLSGQPNETVIFDNTFEAYVPIYCPGGSGNPCVEPHTYEHEFYWDTEPVEQGTSPQWSTDATNDPNPKAFVYFEGSSATLGDETFQSTGFFKLPNNDYSAMQYEKWGSYSTRVIEEETNYKGMVTSKEYTYDPTHYYLKQEKTESLYAAEHYITTYEYAHEAYNGITTKFMDLNLLRVPCRTTTYLNSVSNTNALSASFTKYDYSLPVPKPLDSYQYETIVNHSTGTFTLVPFTLTGSNGPAWRISEADVYQYNRTGVPVSARANQVYTKVVAGNGLNAAKATIMSVERPFDATYTGFEDFVYRGLDSSWTSSSYLEEHWFTNETETANTDAVISWSGTTQVCPNSTTYLWDEDVFHHTISVNDITELSVGDEVVVSFDHGSTPYSLNTEITAIYPESILAAAYQTTNRNYLLCFATHPAVPSIHPLISSTSYVFTNVKVDKITPKYRLSGTYARTGEYSYKLPTIRTSSETAKRSPIRPVKIDLLQVPAGCNTPTQEEGCYVNYKASIWLKYDKDIASSSPAFEVPIARSSDEEGDAIYQRGAVNSTTPTSVRIVCKIWNAARTSVISTQTFYPEDLNTMWKQYTVDIAILKGNQQWIEVYVENAISQVGVNLTQLKSVFVDDILIYPSDARYSYSTFDKFGNTTFAVNNDDVFVETTYDEKGRSIAHKNEYGTVTGSTAYSDQVTNWNTANNHVTQRQWVDNGLYNDTRYYIDGFGKTKQVVTSDNMRNARIVSETSVFDDRGRVEKAYKAYYLYGSAFSDKYNNQFQQKTATFYLAQNAFTAVIYEPTPDSKMAAKVLPQADSESSAIVSQQSEYVNTGVVTHPYMSGSPVFAIGTLIVNELINPEGGKIMTYTDNLGRVIMEEHEIGANHSQNSDGSIDFGSPSPNLRTWFVYDGAGRITQVYDPTGRKTEYYYNSLGLVTRAVSPDRGTSEMRYDKYGQVRFTKDANDEAAMAGNSNYDQFNYTKYDKWGRITESGVVTKPINNSSYPGNNFFDDLATINDQNFPASGQPYTQVHIKTVFGDDRYVYNTNRPVKITVFSHHVLNGTAWDADYKDHTHLEYNADGQLNNTVYEYDGLQGLHTFEAVYNAMRLAEGKNYLNGANSSYDHQWRIEFDGFGRPTHNYSVHNGVTTQTGKMYYDPLGNLIMTGIGTTGNSADPHVDYHVIKKNIREQLVSIMSKKFRAGLSYNQNGNIVNQYWSNEYFDPAGSSSVINQYEYTYDHMSRLLGADYKQSTLNENPFAYFDNTSGSFPDDFGCNVNMVSVNGSLQAYFDDLDNLSDPWAKDATNALNELKALYISNNVPHGVMDASELTTFLTNYVNSCTSKKVDSRALEMYFAVQHNDSDYRDSLTNLSPSIILFKYAKLTLLDIPFISDQDCYPSANATVYGYLPDFRMPAASSNSTLYDEAYWYSGNGNISQLNRNDENGVKTVQQYTYGTTGSNRLTGVTWTEGLNTPFTHSYGYDANGNLLDDARNNVSSIDYTFFSDLPAKIENASGEYLYRYDANGKRSVKIRGNHDDEYYLEGVILKQDGTVKSYQTAEGYAEPNNNGTSVAYYYNVTDWMGTTRVVIDADGAIYNSADFYPYGKKLPGRAVFVTGPEGYRYQYTGHELDDETGYQYHGARYYSEELGRYMSVDPWADKFTGWSTYAYVLGNPIMLTDPTGKGPTGWVQEAGSNQIIWDDRVESAADAEYYHPGSTFYEYGSTIENAQGQYLRLLDAKIGDPWALISETDYKAGHGVFVPGAFYSLGQYGWQESTMLDPNAVSAEDAATAEFIAGQISTEKTAQMMYLGNAAFYRAFVQPIEEAQQAQLENQHARLQSPLGIMYELSPFSAVPVVADYIGEGSYAAAAGIAALEFTPWDEVGDIMKANARAFDAIKRRLGPAGFNMDWHHLVEQHKHNVRRFGIDAIQNSNNLIRLDRDVHYEINRHFGRLHVGPGGFRTNRDYVKSLSFEEQRAYSLQLIKDFYFIPPKK